MPISASYRMLLRACGAATMAVVLMAAGPAAVKVGVLGNVQGTATAMGADNVKRTLKPGDDLFQGDVIRTDDNSNAQILFLDKSALTLTPGSEVKMDSFVYNPGSGDGRLSIEEAKGAFRFIGGALSKQNHVEIKTPVSTIGIRGGIEQTHITPEGDNAESIFVYGHDMTVKDKSGRQMTLTKFGEGSRVLKGGHGPVKMARNEVAQRFKHYSRINSKPGRMQRKKAGLGPHHRGGAAKERREERREQHGHKDGQLPWKHAGEHGAGKGQLPWKHAGEQREQHKAYWQEKLKERRERRHHHFTSPQ